ncbi:hypothetical protein [[Erwinia] mediterraneensis]|uniref:hypothetical protein n=1 Tax=[Erwinia] mediterraneensis TaxID=2161819 RepID=UPI0010323475|nr:hypothetical protein [[Erwinia] mediterraneensis]
MPDIPSLSLPLMPVVVGDNASVTDENAQEKPAIKLARQLSSVSSSQETVIVFPQAGSEQPEQEKGADTRITKWFSRGVKSISTENWEDEEIKNVFSTGQQIEFVCDQARQARQRIIVMQPPGRKRIGWKNFLLGFGAGVLTIAGGTAAYFNGRGSGREAMPADTLQSFTSDPEAETLEGYTFDRPLAEKWQMNSRLNYTTPTASTAQPEYNSAALLKVDLLNNYDRIKEDKRIPDSLRYLREAGLINRDAYNRYLYPMLLDAAASLRTKAQPVTGKNLMAELITILSAATRRLEEFNLAQALRIDPFYDELIVLHRELSRQEKLPEATARPMQMVNAKWLTRKLRDAITVSELDELQQESKTLIKYYSRANNLNASYHYGNKLRAITDKINYALYQLMKKLTYSGVDKYLTDYFSGWLLNLDKNVCNDIRENNLHPDECRLFEGIGFALFRNKDNASINSASLLIAYKLLFPRLKQIINSAHLRIGSKEHRFIELILCDISSQRDILYCSDNYAPDSTLAGKMIRPSPAITNREHNATGKEIESYVIKPIPFDGEMPQLLAEVGAGIGAAAGTIVGAGGISVAVWQNEKGLKAIENLDVGDSGSVRTDIFPAIVNSDAESSVASENIAINTKRGKDLDAFPPIPFPPLEHRDHMLFWNTRARAELKGKDYIVTRGITREVSGEVPEYISQTQVRLQAGFAETAEMIKNLRIKLQSELGAKNPNPEYRRYITEYFSKAIDTEDAEVIEMCITRFREAIDAMDEFFKKTQEQNYRNIFIISTRQRETAINGKYVSLLSEDELATVPDAMTSRSSNPTIAVVCDQTYQASSGHDDLVKIEIKNNIPDMLRHEASHAAVQTMDYYYPPRTPQGRLVNAKEAYRSLKSSLQDMGIQKDLKEAILKFTQENGIPTPFSSEISINSESSVDANRIMALLREFPKFRGYILVNNAENLATYAGDIGRGVPYDAAPPQ